MPDMGTTSGMELLLPIEPPQPGRPRRVQLESALRDAVRNGRLAAGQRLPASRVLAGDLGVSRRLVVEVYTQGREHEDLYQLAEALIDWDEQVGVWRFRHVKMVGRVIGEDVVGTQGTPVELLAGLIKHKMFPELWTVRTDLTELAKESD